jgi:cullin-associated NEDD8-dissociated protein 1
METEEEDDENEEEYSDDDDMSWKVSLRFHYRK